MARLSDGNVYASNGLGKKMMRHILQLLTPERIPTISEALPYIFLGDEAFLMSKNLMRPYLRKHVTGKYEHQVFNVRISRARQTVK